MRCCAPQVRKLSCAHLVAHLRLRTAHRRLLKNLPLCLRTAIAHGVTKFCAPLRENVRVQAGARERSTSARRPKLRPNARYLLFTALRCAVPPIKRSYSKRSKPSLNRNARRMKNPYSSGNMYHTRWLSMLSTLSLAHSGLAQVEVVPYGHLDASLGCPCVQSVRTFLNETTPRLLSSTGQCPYFSDQSRCLPPDHAQVGSNQTNVSFVTYCILCVFMSGHRCFVLPRGALARHHA